MADFPEILDEAGDRETMRKRRLTGNSPNEEGPACQHCRRKKAKCSRLQPCSHCERQNIECIYEDKRSKPGMRTGAIEHLSRRIETLENMFLGQGVLWQQVARCLDAVGSAESSASGRGSCAAASGNPAGSTQTLRAYTARLKRTLMPLSGNVPDQEDQEDQGSDKEDQATDQEATAERSSKRQKRGVSDKQTTLEVSEPEANLADSTNTSKEAPPTGGIDIDLPADLLESLVDIYFTRLHPWIPMLHVRQFRQKMVDPAQRHRLTNIFYAITSLCVRFSGDERLGRSAGARADLAKKCRETVILQSMQSFSVENLQALIICAFDTISSGRSPSAWSIIGSMTRTVEQLQLSVEDEDQPQATTKAKVLIRRIAFLPPACDWLELEERRRVFWNVFLMDRFCSIATGWNLSLTSVDVKRRLPCEGVLWEQGRIEVPTPYFGVSDQVGTTSKGLPSALSDADDQESLGGFAYCIEATESLSLVTSFFLQHAIDMAKPQDVQMWLMRFKQLDLRLCRWKLFLPERWRDANSRNADNNLDPNLILAHITHNTAVVLLHQGIAYPSAEWQSIHTPIRLPSATSLETCLMAATEVSIIAENFLRETDCLTNPQFAFCLFICGRMVLAHASYYKGASLPLEFDSMISSLWEISRRWNGTLSGTDGSSSSPQENLASKFASRLMHAKQMGASLDIRQTAYSEDHVSSSAPATQTPTGISYLSPSNAVHFGESPDSMSLAFPPLPLAFQSASSLNNTVFSEDVHTAGYSTSAPTDHTTDDSVLEDLNSFLDYSFLPNQRVSIYSHPTEKHLS